MIEIDIEYIDRLSDNDRLSFRCLLFKTIAEMLAERLKRVNDNLISAFSEIEKLKLSKQLEISKSKLEKAKIELNQLRQLIKKD